MKDFIKRKYESFWIYIAKQILMGRNVKRCMVVTRRDNNEMWYMAEKLERIAKNISTGYKKQGGFQD